MLLNTYAENAGEDEGAGEPALDEALDVAGGEAAADRLRLPRMGGAPVVDIRLATAELRRMKMVVPPLVNVESEPKRIAQAQKAAEEVRRFDPLWSWNRSRAGEDGGVRDVAALESQFHKKLTAGLAQSVDQFPVAALRDALCGPLYLDEFVAVCGRGLPGSAIYEASTCLECLTDAIDGDSIKDVLQIMVDTASPLAHAKLAYVMQHALTGPEATAMTQGLIVAQNVGSLYLLVCVVVFFARTQVDVFPYVDAQRRRVLEQCGKTVDPVIKAVFVLHYLSVIEVTTAGVRSSRLHSLVRYCSETRSQITSSIGSLLTYQPTFGKDVLWRGLAGRDPCMVRIPPFFDACAVADISLFFCLSPAIARPCPSRRATFACSSSRCCSAWTTRPRCRTSSPTAPYPSCRGRARCSTRNTRARGGAARSCMRSCSSLGGSRSCGSSRAPIRRRCWRRTFTG